MKIKLSYLLLAISFSVAFQSCSKDDTDSYAEWRQENENFINEIKNNRKYHQASISGGSGTIYYEVLKEGNGNTPIYTSQVKVYYKGSLINGTVFEDSSRRIFSTTVGSNISGFAVALQNMKVGDKWKIYIPWELGYGSTGSGSISPYSALIFELELVEITKY